MTRETFEKATQIMCNIRDIEDAIQRITEAKGGVYLQSRVVSDEDQEEITAIVKREVEARLGSKLNTLNAQLAAL